MRAFAITDIVIQNVGTGYLIGRYIWVYSIGISYDGVAQD